MLIKSIPNKIEEHIRRVLFLFNLYSVVPSDKVEQKKIRKLFRYILSHLTINDFWISSSPSTVTSAVEIFGGLSEENAFALARRMNIISNYGDKFFDYVYGLVQGKVDNHYSGKNAPKILLVSHEFSLTGAPKAVLNMAKTIREIYGVAPIVTYLQDGKIKEEFIEADIPCIDYNDFPIETKRYNEFMDQFDLVIANSCAWDFFDHISGLKVPVIWWSHEIFKQYNLKKTITKFISHVHSYWAGSPLTKKIFQDNFPQKNGELVLYGLDHIDLESQKHEYVTFSVMGTPGERKAQDVFIKAIKVMPAEIRHKARFKIVGVNPDESKDSIVMKKLRSLAQGIPEIEFINEMPFSELLEHYKAIDVVVVPSRADPMPIVATYGLMFSKLCICSDAVGTTLLMQDGYNGLIFKNEDSRALSKMMQAVIENPQAYEAIAKNGFEIYKNNFSEEMFRQNVKTHIDAIIHAQAQMVTRDKQVS